MSPCTHATSKLILQRAGPQETVCRARLGDLEPAVRQRFLDSWVNLRFAVKCLFSYVRFAIFVEPAERTWAVSNMLALPPMNSPSLLALGREEEALAMHKSK